jgi:hypothetical protein
MMSDLQVCWIFPGPVGASDFAAFMPKLTTPRTCSWAARTATDSLPRRARAPDQRARMNKRL